MYLMVRYEVTPYLSSLVNLHPLCFYCFLIIDGHLRSERYNILQCCGIIQENKVNLGLFYFIIFPILPPPLYSGSVVYYHSLLRHSSDTPFSYPPNHHLIYTSTPFLISLITWASLSVDKLNILSVFFLTK